MILTQRGVRLLVAMSVGGTFAGLLVSLIFLEVPAGNRDIIKVLVGFVGGAFVTMVAYYFGDSDGTE